MKIIHCADLHLDSQMTANLDRKKSKERKIELFNTYGNMIKYAAENNIEAILIAGDLFDKKTVTKMAANTVYRSFIDNPDIDFYILKGNHDEDMFLDNIEEIPENVKTFGEKWTSYRIGKNDNVVITGAVLNKENKVSLFNELVLNNDDFNILTLHGQESAGQTKDKTVVIPLRSLRNKGIDYLALGHIHTYKEAELDKRGVYCYSGCLEGRGFDECGEHGFVVLNIDEDKKTCEREFVSIAKRVLYTIDADISGLNSSAEIISRIKSILNKKEYSKESLIKIVLTGEVDAFCEKDTDYILKQFEDKYYFVKLYDETKLKVSYEDFALDESLKGEFVRIVLAKEEISDEDKAEIIRYGINILSGEEI
ncbi:MAG: DNA repair exonuclease [Lachnospiraceae bacterium]|nr:DNA repair exonuclease [Lachnospiraceae bacterium]